MPTGDPMNCPQRRGPQSQYMHLQGNVGAVGFPHKRLFFRLSDQQCFDFTHEIPLRITISSTHYWQTYVRKSSEQGSLNRGGNAWGHKKVGD